MSTYTSVDAVLSDPVIFSYIYFCLAPASETVWLAHACYVRNECSLTTKH